MEGLFFYLLTLISLWLGIYNIIPALVFKTPLLKPNHEN